MARGGALSARGGEFRPVYHLAGFDDELRLALEDVRIGRWMSMRELLAGTGENWPLRTARTQILGAVAAKSAVVQIWLDEQPSSADARAMHARVAVARAMQAHRQRHPSARGLEDDARKACHEAALQWPEDPVPWVCLLTLAQLDVRQERPEHRVSPPENLLPYGPWGLLDEVVGRDPYNREAFHRVLQLCNQAGGSQAYAMDFARWVGSWAPSGSPLLVLPLFAHAEHYHFERKRGRGEALVHRQWSREDILRDTLRALHGWFDQTASVPRERSVLDLNYLAHALTAAREFAQAARVFEALGPFATLLPWSYVTEDPERQDLAEAEFVRARALALSNR